MTLRAKPCSERGAICTLQGGPMIEDVSVDIQRGGPLKYRIDDANGNEDDKRINFTVTLLAQLDLE